MGDNVNMGFSFACILIAIIGVASVFIIARYTTRTLMLLIPSLIGAISICLWILLAQWEGNPLELNIIQVLVILSLVLVLSNGFTVFFYWNFTRIRKR